MDIEHIILFIELLDLIFSCIQKLKEIIYCFSLNLKLNRTNQAIMVWFSEIIRQLLLCNVPLTFQCSRPNTILLQTPGLNIITEYLMGVIYPGRPIANVCFKVYGYMSMSQAIAFLNDFKLGHYMKIPPRSMFLVQVNSNITNNNTNTKL